MLDEMNGGWDLARVWVAGAKPPGDGHAECKCQAAGFALDRGKSWIWDEN